MWGGSNNMLSNIAEDMSDVWFSSAIDLSALLTV
jgi:hypothetical protein